MPDPDDGSKVIVVEKEDVMQAVQSFITLKGDEFAIIYNPPKTYEPDYPNGKWSYGRVDVPSLQKGAKRIVVSGFFPQWPGQNIEVQKVFTLAPDQYLLVKVISEEIDQGAPYYETVMRCASIKTAVVDEINNTQNLSSQDESDTEKTKRPRKLVVGQLIIIPGNITPQFIPPTGIEVVADAMPTAVKENADGLSNHEVIKRAIDQEIINVDNLLIAVQKADILLESTREIQLELKNHPVDDRLFAIIANRLNGDQKADLADYLRPKLTPAKKNSSPNPYIRQAKTPGPTQFCTLIDEKGESRNVNGPGCVLPGPGDTFRIEGTTDGVYNDYHLRSSRGILLRVVAEVITYADLIEQLPFGAIDQLEKQTYRQGDEIFLRGFDAYLVPSSAVEVIDPITRQPHIGNNHSGIYVEAITLDQKSGAYVRQVETGNVPLIRGEKKLLLDPRKEVHEKRQVPPDLWNLLIGAGEPHKKVPESTDRIITPWALSVVVPNNEAMLLTSRIGRRPVIGPRTELLEYEEVPEVLNLSKGRPKTDKDTLRTCFLRIDGNHVTDSVYLEPSGGVTRLKVELSYGVRFVTQKPGEEEISEETKIERMIAWFNNKNYVQLLVDSTRSRLRASARSRSLEELFLHTEDFVRDTILGLKPEGGHRPGFLCEENWMFVYEVNVLSVEIPDQEIADAMQEAHHKVTIGQINETTEQNELTFAQKKDARERELSIINMAALKRKEELALANITSKHEESVAAQGSKDSLEQIIQSAKISLKKVEEEADDIIAQMKRESEAADERSKLAVMQEKRDAVLKLRTALADIEKDLIKAEADAQATKLGAVQEKLVEAIEGLGDKQVLTALAEHMPPASGELGFLLGLGGTDGVLNMLRLNGDSSLARRLKNVMKTIDTVGAETDADLKNKTQDQDITKG